MHAKKENLLQRLHWARSSTRSGQRHPPMPENAANLRSAPALLSCVAQSPVVHPDSSERYQPQQPRLPLSPLHSRAGPSPLGRLALADGCPRSLNARLLLVILRGPAPILRFPVSYPTPKKRIFFPPHTLNPSSLTKTKRASCPVD